MLNIKNLNVILNSNNKCILKTINLRIKKNELVGIIGESGCGKTTLINTISSFCDTNFFKISGEIFFEDKNLLNFSDLEKRKFCTENMSVILQDSINTLNPYEKLKKQLLEEYIKTHSSNLSKKEILKKISKDLENFGLNNIEIILNSYPNELSGGMKQRLSIILTLYNKNIKLLLADEPTTSLDVINQQNFIKFLKNICLEKDITLIYVSHDMKLLSQICDRIIVMKKGEILEDNLTKEILEDPKNDYTKLLVEAFNFFEM